MKTMPYKGFVRSTIKILAWIVICLFDLTSCKGPVKNKTTKTKNEIINGSKAKAPEDETIFNSLDKNNLLTRLFDGPIFDKKGIAIWKPNYSERMTYQVSYDGKCHTAIDTIMYYTDRHNKKCAVVILATYNYRRSELDSAIKISDCHFCGVPIGIALFSKNDANSWELYKFEKAFTSLGYFGQYRTGRQDAGKISLKKTGDSWTSLSMIQGIGGNMGELTGTETLYSIERYDLNGFPNQVLSEILSYNYYYKIDEENGRAKGEQKIEMKILKKKGDYYNIDLIVNNNRNLSIRHYKYSDEYSRYIDK